MTSEQEKPPTTKTKRAYNRKHKIGRPRIPLVCEDIGETERKLPPKPIDFEAVFHWMDLGATQEEIAGSFRVSVDTLQRRLVEQTGHSFAELKEKVCGQAKINLRHNQYRLAKTNAAVCIWLGKIWLGQKDEQLSNSTQALQIFNLTKMLEENDQLRKDLEMYKKAQEGKD